MFDGARVEVLVGASVDADDIAHLRALPRRSVEVPRVLTPASAVDVRIALVAGYASTFPERVPNAAEVATVTQALGPGVHGVKVYVATGMDLAVRVALAQLCVEHGAEPWGGEQTKALAKAGLPPGEWLQPKYGDPSYLAIWTNNIGNRQVTRENAGDVPMFWLRAREVVRVGRETREAMASSACYAYPNLAEGAAGYWRFLRDHCGPALAAFERGDPAAAAHELKVGRWHYSGSEAEYARAMVDRFMAIP